MRPYFADENHSLNEEIFLVKVLDEWVFIQPVNFCYIYSESNKFSYWDLITF